MRVPTHTQCRICAPHPQSPHQSHLQCERPLTPKTKSTGPENPIDQETILGASAHSHPRRDPTSLPPPTHITTPRCAPSRTPNRCRCSPTVKVRAATHTLQTGARQSRKSARQRTHFPGNRTPEPTKCQPPLTHCRSHRSAREAEPSNQAALPICNNRAPSNVRAATHTFQTTAPHTRESARQRTHFPESRTPEPTKCASPRAPFETTGPLSQKCQPSHTLSMARRRRQTVNPSNQAALPICNNRALANVCAHAHTFQAAALPSPQSARRRAHFPAHPPPSHRPPLHEQPPPHIKKGPRVALTGAFENRRRTKETASRRRTTA